MVTESELEHVACELTNSAFNKLNLSEATAKRNFARAMGIFTYLEEPAGIEVCRDWLRYLCEDKHEYDTCRAYGHDFLEGILSLTERIGKIIK